MTGEWLCLYIDWRLCEAYRQQGWDVTWLPWPHSRYSMLAVREVVA